MFVLCPHCQFLVAVDARTGLPPAACPKCGGAIVVEAPGEVTPGHEVSDDALRAALEELV